MLNIKFYPSSFSILKNMKNVGLYANYFMFDTIKRYYICALQIIYKNNIKSILIKIVGGICIHVHFIVKFVTGFVYFLCIDAWKPLEQRRKSISICSNGERVLLLSSVPLLIAIRIWGLR